MSGYEACGSVSGSLLQLFNLILGTLLYIPFIRLSENQQSEEFETAVRTMETDMAEGEANGALPDSVSYTHLDVYKRQELTFSVCCRLVA